MDTILHQAADRHALRRQLRMPCQVVCEQGFTLLAQECVDLSLEGMGVRALLPASEGSPVLVSFRLPNSSLYIDIEGHIARMVWGRRREDAGALLGLRFTALHRTDRAILASRLRGLPPPVPRRRVRVDYASSVRAIGLAQ
jgi:hypothetical protein